jgi:3-phenylpropionate/trans-cinnamate dioxygenase ferredoxin subunit/anthranilate 1,2-dioxygenase ferredoxin subunit
MAFVKLAQGDEIPDGGMIMKEHDGRQILLARVEGQVYAMDNICNHQGAELHEGELGQEGSHLVTCPWHAAHFDLRTGKVHQDTDWATDLETFGVELRDGDVYVDV